MHEHQGGLSAALQPPATRQDTMPLIFQDRITSDDLRGHPDRLYLFGDNEQRHGHGGQAAACRGHANAVGIATKRAPERTNNAYWADADYDRIITIIDHDLAPAFVHVRKGGTVVCPTAGLGTGLAELPSRAPRIFAYIRQSVIRLKRLGTPAGNSAIPRILNMRDIRGPLLPNARYCGRPSPWGNPFIIGRDGTRDEVCDKHQVWLPTQSRLMAMIPALTGQDLVCHCAPERCHCNFLRRLANPHLFCPG
jgi:hypothetical protein